MNQFLPLNEATANAQPLCEQCGTAFTPRSHSGGRAQKFCGEDCRRQYHAASTTPTPPTPKSGVGKNDPPAVSPQPLLKPFVEAPAGTPSTGPALIIADQNDTDDFDWAGNDTVLLHEQLSVAAYLNPHGDLVLREKADWPHSTDDKFIIIAENNIQAFIDRLCDLHGIPSFGGPQP